MATLEVSPPPAATSYRPTGFSYHLPPPPSSAATSTPPKPAAAKSGGGVPPPVPAQHAHLLKQRQSSGSSKQPPPPPAGYTKATQRQTETTDYPDWRTYTSTTSDDVLQRKPTPPPAPTHRVSTFTSSTASDTDYSPYTSSPIAHTRKAATIPLRFGASADYALPLADSTDASESSTSTSLYNTSSTSDDIDSRTVNRVKAESYENLSNKLFGREPTVSKQSPIKHTSSDTRPISYPAIKQPTKQPDVITVDKQSTTSTYSQVKQAVTSPPLLKDLSLQSSTTIPVDKLPSYSYSSASSSRRPTSSNVDLDSSNSQQQNNNDYLHQLVTSLAQQQDTINRRCNLLELKVAQLEDDKHQLQVKLNTFVAANPQLLQSMSPNAQSQQQASPISDLSAYGYGWPYQSQQQPPPPSIPQPRTPSHHSQPIPQHQPQQSYDSPPAADIMRAGSASNPVKCAVRDCFKPAVTRCMKHKSSASGSGGGTNDTNMCNRLICMEHCHTVEKKASLINGRASIKDYCPQHATEDCSVM